MKTRLLLFCFALLFFSKNIHAQKDYIPIRLGVQFAQAKDTYYSPIPYKGFGFLAGLGIERSNNDVINRYEIVNANGSMKANMEGKNLGGQGFSTIHSNLHIAPRIDWDNQNEFFVGVSWKVNLNMRSSKNISMDFATSVSLVANVARNITTDNVYGSRIEAGVSLPLFAYIARPQFSVPMYAYRKKKFPRSMHTGFVTFNKYFALDFNVRYTDYLESGNAYRFGYDWQYSQISPLHKVQTLNQNLFFDLMWGYNTQK